MRKALTTTAIAAFALFAVVVGAPHRVQADTNGICIINGLPVDPTEAIYANGVPIQPNCTLNRQLEVMPEPDPSGSPFNVNVISLPSSAPINGSVTVTNFPTPVAVQPVVESTTVPITGSVSVTNFPAAAAYPTPPANQAVTVTNTPSVTVNNFPTPVPLQAVSVPSPIAISNFPATQPVSAATNLPVVMPAAKYTVLSAAGTTSMSGAKVFIGAADISTSAQITAVTCYDNASAASGTVILNTVLGLTNPWFPGGGIGLTNGLTCNVPLVLLGNGIAVYWRTF